MSSASSGKFSFFRTAPEGNARAVCGCHPVFCVMSASVAPVFRRNSLSTTARFVLVAFVAGFFRLIAPCRASFRRYTDESPPLTKIIRELVGRGGRSRTQQFSNARRRPVRNADVCEETMKDKAEVKALAFSTPAFWRLPVLSKSGPTSTYVSCEQCAQNRTLELTKLAMRSEKRRHAERILFSLTTDNGLAKSPKLVGRPDVEANAS